jgi:hypothetical protein
MTYLREALMPAPNLKNMDVDALLTLRTQIDSHLATRRSDLQKQLARLQRVSADAPAATGNGRTSAMKASRSSRNTGTPRLARRGPAVVCSRAG